jgi:hypothetical protein
LVGRGRALAAQLVERLEAQVELLRHRVDQLELRLTALLDRS